MLIARIKTRLKNASPRRVFTTLGKYSERSRESNGNSSEARAASTRGNPFLSTNMKFAMAHHNVSVSRTLRSFTHFRSTTPQCELCVRQRDESHPTLLVFRPFVCARI